ncbi:Lsr2 dimerization domain-containing protein [Pseudonocardia acidicola]|uniref:Lsr2 protein n=1 Tax=Pseudonocardia acidicola TaxID=2724939 RepID=A0ABX1SF23_9PSEU|nr:hypothetical protein [Pseudonocardia acidicola]
MGVRQIRYCDISGTEPAESHEINIDQMRIEIDLSGAEYERLLEILGPYIDAGRVEAAARNVRTARPGGAGGSSALTPDERARLKQWAASAGIDLPPKGRFKRAIIDQWRAQDQG